MSTSTNAILFYGIAYDEGEELPEDLQEIDYEMEQKDSEANVPKPKYDPDKERNDPAYAALWDDWRNRLKEWEGSQCRIDTHCHSEYPMYYICIKGSQTIAYRGDVMAITSLEVKPDWNDKLKAHCERLGIPYREPGWSLVAYWSP